MSSLITLLELKDVLWLRQYIYFLTLCKHITQKKLSLLSLDNSKKKCLKIYCWRQQFYMNNKFMTLKYIFSLDRVFIKYFVLFPRFLIYIPDSEPISMCIVVYRHFPRCRTARGQTSP